MATNKRDKLGQVIQNFFLKATNIIIQSRTIPLQEPAQSNQQAKPNKWFNLELPDQNPEELRLWKSGTQTVFAPIIVETFLDLRELTIKQALVLKDDDSNSWNINTKKSEIVMERWLIEIDPSVTDDSNADLPLLYKQLIIMFRYLYTITRLLPTAKLFKRLEKVKLTKSPLKIGARVLEGNRAIVSKGRIGLSRPIITTETHLLSKEITPVTTPIGALKISVSYRKQIDFELIDNEETLSSHFLNLDKARINNPSSLQKKAFRSGTASPPPSSSPRSNASIIQSLKIQRANSVSAQTPSLPKSITSSVGSTSHYVPIPGSSLNDQLSSSGSAPKYSSSFQRVARRSSLRRSSSVDRGYSTSVNERGTPSSFRTQGTTGDDDLKDFLNLLDSKPDLKLSYSPNVEDSLGRFQSMKPQNDQLTESLSASMFKPTLPSHSPHSQSNSPQLHGNSPNALQSLLQYSGSPRWGINAGSITKRLSEGNISNDSLLLKGSSPKYQSSRVSSASPASAIMRHGSRSFSVGPSNPTIATSTTTAKMYREISGVNTTSTPTSTTKNDEDDEDDLLFAMSDMNLPKT